MVMVLSPISIEWGLFALDVVASAAMAVCLISGANALQGVPQYDVMMFRIMGALNGMRERVSHAMKSMP